MNSVNELFSEYFSMFSTLSSLFDQQLAFNVFNGLPCAIPSHGMIGYATQINRRLSDGLDPSALPPLPVKHDEFDAWATQFQRQRQMFYTTMALPLVDYHPELPKRHASAVLQRNTTAQAE